jgi:exo-beta-1,3-glucanase (GH17 family)
MRERPKEKKHKKKKVPAPYGVCFEPYVGPWDSSQPVLYNAYSLDQVKNLIKAIRTFGILRTYGQGTFVWQGTPKIQDSNMYNIEAAATENFRVVAGCYQQGANPPGDSINVDWTKTEIDYAIDQAKKHMNVTELVIGNECIWGPNSTDAITTLMAYAKDKRDKAGFGQANLPVTTCQIGAVLAGVNNTKPPYAPTQQAIKKLLAACEGFVYANMYAYFDADIATKIGTNPTEDHFKKAITDSLNTQLTALQNAFVDQSVLAQVRIGETGWPTKGSQTAQPDASLASVTNAQWHYEAVSSWAQSNSLKVFMFEAYDEPWKGDATDDNSEAHFGIYTAEGTSSAPNQYTLTGETQKYTT